MARVVLAAAKCSQMTHPTSGTGSGGDRCTEACGAMVDSTYHVSSWAKSGFTPEEIMYKFTESLNNGRDVSSPKNFVWFQRWIESNTHRQILLGDVVWPSFGDVVNCINRGHIAVAGFDDYTNLRLINGAKPWPWSDPHGLGHVLVVVGYDTATGAVVVHDPLRADPSGMPADYSWTSFQAARCHDLIEVKGPALGPNLGTYFGGSAIYPTPSATPAQQTTQQVSIQLQAAIQFLENFIVTVLQLVASYFTKGRLT